MAAEIQTRNNTVGTNIEHLNMFMYNGRWYSFAAFIFNSLEESMGDKSRQALDNQHIESFEYVNQINNICITGDLVYRDIDGSISRFFNKNYNHIEVVCEQLVAEAVGNGTGETGQLTKLLPAGSILQKSISFVAKNIIRPIANFIKAEKSEYSTFQHTFIIQNVEILNRDKKEITYKLHLISENWYKASARIDYSNYGFTKASLNAEDEKNVFVLIRKFLMQVGLETDKESFDKAIEQTKNIQIDYITNGNDTVFTIIPYLMNRLYFIDKFSDVKIFFYISYDIVKNNYKVINYKDQSTWLGVFRPAVVMSLFETSYEQSLFSENNQLATTRSMTQTKLFENLFTKKYWTFDYENGDYSEAVVDTPSLVDLYNSKSDILENVDGKTEEKYQDLQVEAFVNKDRYVDSVQETNNSYRIYNDLVDAFVSKDALIVNCENDMTHRPGGAMGIVLDRTIEKVPETIPTSDLEALYKKHRQIEQIFMIFKSRHMYKLTTPAACTENVILARNFLLTPREVGKPST